MAARARLGVLVLAALSVSSGERMRRSAAATEHVPEQSVRLESFSEYGPDGVLRDGFRTEDGEVVVPPVYTSSRAFSEGLAAVQNSAHQWGFVSDRGVVVVPPQYDSVLSFSEGFAAVKRHGTWGYIDRDGNVVLPFQYRDAGPFYEGLAEVQLPGESLMAVIDASGRVVIPSLFQRIYGFEGGYAKAQAPETGLWGIVDRQGSWVIAPMYDQCSRSGNEVTGFIEELWGFIGREGSWRIPPTYLNATEFVDGVATARRRGGQERDAIFLAGEGEVIAGPFKDVREFLGGVGEFQCAEYGGWGSIDARGRLLQPCDPEEGRPKHESVLTEMAREHWVRHLGRGRASGKMWLGFGGEPRRDRLWIAEIEVDGRRIRQFREGVAGFQRLQDPGCPAPWGIVRVDGSVVTEPRYSLVGEPSEGLIPVCVPLEGAPKPEYCDQCHCDVPLNLCGYVDLDGNVRVPLEHLVDFRNSADPFAYVRGFHHGLAALQDGKEGSMGYIDRTGRRVIPPRFESAGDFAANGLAPASTPSKTVTHDLPSH